jgi:hypothetical protein
MAYMRSHSTETYEGARVKAPAAADTSAVVVILDDLGHEAVHGAARGGNEMHVTSAQLFSASNARSTASILPRMRRTRFRSGSWRQYPGQHGVRALALINPASGWTDSITRLRRGAASHSGSRKLGSQLTRCWREMDSNYWYQKQIPC